MIRDTVSYNPAKRACILHCTNTHVYRMFCQPNSLGCGARTCTSVVVGMNILHNVIRASEAFADDDAPSTQRHALIQGSPFFGSVLSKYSSNATCSTVPVWYHDQSSYKDGLPPPKEGFAVQHEQNEWHEARVSICGRQLTWRMVMRVACHIHSLDKESLHLVNEKGGSEVVAANN
jgi:hypothetical protein